MTISFFYFLGGECKKTEFECLNKKCIPLSKTCDGIKDCRDNSDEINCRSNFNSYRSFLFRFANNLQKRSVYYGIPNLQRNFRLQRPK